MRRYPDVCKLGWNFKSYVSLCVNKYCNGAENNTYTCFGEICSCCCCLPLLPHLACNNLATMILQLFSLKLRVDLAVCLVCLVRFLARILSLPPSTWCDVWDSYSSPYRRGRGLRGLSCQNIPGVRYLFIVHILHTYEHISTKMLFRWNNTISQIYRSKEMLILKAKRDGWEEVSSDWHVLWSKLLPKNSKGFWDLR